MPTFTPVVQSQRDSNIKTLGNMAGIRDRSHSNSENGENSDNSEEELCADLQCLSLFIRNIVVYIAGWVGRTISAKITCASYCLTLIASDAKNLLLDKDSLLLSEK